MSPQKLSYAIPKSIAERKVLRRIDSANQIMLVIRPEFPGFWSRVTALSIGAVLFLLVAALSISLGGMALTVIGCLSLIGFAVTVMGLLMAWNRSRMRVIFELQREHLCVRKMAPISRSRKVFARTILADLVVHERGSDRGGDNETYCLRLYLTWNQETYHYDFLHGQPLDLLRNVVDILRLELGWPGEDSKSGPDAEKISDA